MARTDPFLWVLAVLFFRATAEDSDDSPEYGKWYDVRCFSKSGIELKVEDGIAHSNNGTMSIAFTNWQTRVPNGSDEVICKTWKRIPGHGNYISCPFQNWRVRSNPTAKWIFIGFGQAQHPAWRSVPGTGALDISDLTTSDEGTYICKIRTAAEGIMLEYWGAYKDNDTWRFYYTGFQGESKEFVLKKGI